MNHSASSSSPRSGSTRSNTDRVLKVLGALVVLWAAAKVLGWLLSPGFILLAIALWFVVRSQRKAQKPPAMAYFTPAPMAPWQAQPTWQGQANVQAMNPVNPMYAYQPHAYQPHPGGMQAPQPPVPGMYMPAPATTAPMSYPVSPAPGEAKILDHRTQAEREIEDFVERSWPNV
jgi:hypothetical protein